MQKDKPATAGSNILEGFVSPINATVVDRLKAENIEIAGRVAMDEFGLRDPFAEDFGEVSAAVKSVVDGKYSACLCNDLFGKYRRQSAENGVCYIHPTYGTVSRFGLIPLACSMDQIGLVCKNLADGFKLLSIIAGKDEGDGAMFPEISYSYSQAKKDITLGIPNGIVNNSDKILKGKFACADIELKHFDLYKQAMYILGSAEISGNLSRYDGIKFGHRAKEFRGVNDLYLKTRTQGFGLSTKLAVVMGSMALSQDYYQPYYEKSLELRRVIKESLKFDEYDVIALPCKINGNAWDNLSLYALANLAGLPSVAFSYDGQGIMLIANVNCESLLLKAWEVSLA